MSFFSKLFGFNSEPAAQPVEQTKTDEELIGDVQKMMLLMEVKRQAELYGDTDTVNAVLNMTYDGQLPEKLPDGSYTSLYEEELSFNIAGINYREGIADYLGRSTGYIKPEPKNRHDPNAIAVYADDGHHLGYIPATDTYEVHSLRLRFPIPVSVDIEECYDDDDRQFYVGEVTFQVQTKKPAK